MYLYFPKRSTRRPTYFSGSRLHAGLLGPHLGLHLAAPRPAHLQRGAPVALRGVGPVRRHHHLPVLAHGTAALEVELRDEPAEKLLRAPRGAYIRKLGQVKLSRGGHGTWDPLFYLFFSDALWTIVNCQISQKETLPKGCPRPPKLGPSPSFKGVD